jgi:hypothetical protein
MRSRGLSEFKASFAPAAHFPKPIRILLLLSRDQLKRLVKDAKAILAQIEANERIPLSASPENVSLSACNGRRCPLSPPGKGAQVAEAWIPTA